MMFGFRLTVVIVISLWLCDDTRQVLGQNGDFPLNLARAVDQDVWLKRISRNLAASTQDPQCERLPIYICEDTPNSVPAHIEKKCNYRSQYYHEQVYRWVAGRGCLLYIPDFLYVGGTNPINLNAGCLYGTHFAPCLELPKEDGTCGCYPFDPGLEEVVTAVREAMVPSAHGRWERCFYAAADCCSHHMIDNYTEPNHCDATFDGWTCWQPAEAGTTALEVCSEFAYSGQGPSCNHYSTKQCYADATWELQTDYSPCSITPRLLRRYRFYIISLAFSIVSCLPAVFVFFFYKRLRNNTRVVLHRNLLITIIVKNILVIVSRSEIYIDELTNPGDTVMSTHGVLCRVLAFAERVSVNAVFVCMLIEGVYLHRMIVAIFRQKLNVNVLYGIGGLIAILPAVAWAVVMSQYDDHSCWQVYTVPHIQWVLDAPRVAILIINTILFVDVIRVLLTKVRNSENAHQLNTAKATLFLMPIFGVQFILTAFRPGTDNCTGEQAYYYISYSFESLQGFIVALLYCYVNKEVHKLVKSTYRRAETAVVSVVRRDSNYPKLSIKTNDRKMTLSTAISNNPDGKEQNNTITPNLHVAKIISIQANERLAEILEPKYETVGGITNEGYDSLERDDNYASMTVKDDNSFLNASSTTIDCQYWLQSTSASAFYDELKDASEGTDSAQPSAEKLQENEVKQDNQNQQNSSENDEEHYEDMSTFPATSIFGVDDIKAPIAQFRKNLDKGQETQNQENTSENSYIDGNLSTAPATSTIDDMFHEIMEYIENSPTLLDPKVLSPNRKPEDSIVFVDLPDSGIEETEYSPDSAKDRGEATDAVLNQIVSRC